MELNFCRRCGEPLLKKGTSGFACSNGHRIFANSAPCTRILVLTAENEFLLQIRDIEPYKGQLDTFGGFVEFGESLEAGAVRELFEEANISRDDFDTLRFISSDVAPYPFDGEVLTNLVATFAVRLKPGVVPTAKDEVQAIQQIPLNKLDIRKLTTDEIQKATQDVIDMVNEGTL